WSGTRLVPQIRRATWRADLGQESDRRGLDVHVHPAGTPGGLTLIGRSTRSAVRRYWVGWVRWARFRKSSLLAGQTSTTWIRKIGFYAHLAPLAHSWGGG